MRDDRTLSIPGGSQVRDAMRFDVISVVPEMTVRELIHVLLENEISGAPVVDSAGKIVGYVSATDVIRFASGEIRPAARSRCCGEATTAAANGAEPERAADLTLAAIVRGAAPVSPSCLDGHTVGDLLTPVAQVVRPDDPLPEVVRLMRERQIRRMLVMQVGILHGIITPFDVLDALDRG